MKIGNIQFTPEKETLFLTLYGKALDYRSRNSILNDRYANEIVEKVTIDFSKFSDANNRIVAVRAKQFDEWVIEFITKNSDSVILNLGCGLDTRISRINPPNSVQWFDIDYPEVIELRKQFYTDKNNYKMIGSSVTEENWLKKIPHSQPALIISEGLVSYLTEEDVKTLLNRLTEYFPKGEIDFNIVSPLTANKNRNNVKKATGAEQKWLIDHPAKVDELNPKMHRMETLSLFNSAFVKKLPFKFRMMLKLANLHPKYKNLIQLLRYEF